MKSIRKSLTGNKDGIRSQISAPTPLPSVSKPPSSILPPQKVIKATGAYRPNAPQELSFQKGDFFYVIRELDGGTYYEAHNPITGARGLVPRSMFEEFSKNPTPLRGAQPAGLGIVPPARPGSNVIPTSPISPKSPKSQVFYAVVMHDFAAERADELDAKRGDTVTVVAQSNREWFVAKPIGRLGRPGLIPVAFVEIHDPATGRVITDVQGLMDRGDLPKVEDWKRAMFNYKQNSIALGVIDAPSNQDPGSSSPSMTLRNLYPSNQPPVMAQTSSPQIPFQQPILPPSQSAEPELLPEGIILSGDVVSFHYEMDEFWFRINAVWQPYPPQGQNNLPPARQLVLFRVYNDFYDFQVALLDNFPKEAGREPPNPRILPFMPGPAENVDQQLTATRRIELDEYMHNLCGLAKSGATYIMEHPVVREFFSLKPGDVENEVEPRVRDMETIFSADFSSGPVDDGYSSQTSTLGGAGRSTPYQDMQNSMTSMRIRDDVDSEYDDEGYAPSPQRPVYDRHPYSQAAQNDSNLRLHALKNHQRSGSNSSLPNSRSNSPAPRSNSPMYNGDYSQPQYASGQSYNSQSTTSTHSSQGRARSLSNANNFNSPSISAANPQTAFVKIKIFDRVADDLIAIRVHPRVSHAELMDKVQTRLGGEVANLRYRDSGSNNFVGLDNDQELRLWMENTDKHVLYAD